MIRHFRSYLVVFCLFIVACSTSDHSAQLDKGMGEHKGRGLHYTCRLPNEEVVVTTEKSIAENASTQKAEIFIEKTQYMPIDITDIDIERKGADNRQLEFLEEVVVLDLAGKALEWREGEAHKLTMVANAQNDLPEDERLIQIARVKTHPKLTIYDKQIFSRITGAVLAEGSPVHLHIGVKGEVVSIKGNEVRVEFKPESKHPVDGPFGPVIVTDQGDHYRIEVDAREGRLVRVGPAIGRITNVSANSFKIDYSHPFGGESLTCDAMVTAITRATPPVHTARGGGVEETADGQETAVGSSKVAAAPGKSKTTAQKGDLVKVACTASLKSGEVVWTTQEDIATNPKINKIDQYKTPETFGLETVMVGGEAGFPGVAEAVEGMMIGTRKKITIPAARVFGDRNPQLMQRYDRSKIVPTRVTLPADKYVKQFGGFPVKGKTVAFNAYTVGRVVDVSERGAVLSLAPVKDEIDSDFGLTKMQVVDDKIQIHLTPKLGADFELDKRHGRVVAVDDRQFTVDFNDPLAGEDVVLDVQLVTLTKASRFAGMDIQWIENYDEGLDRAEKANKPTVLVLYADWCGYCKKLFNNTLVDPRIKMMRDIFVWVKVNSDKQKAIKAQYNQKGFPLTVVLDSSGEVIGSINGFRPAGEFRAELEKMLGSVSAESKLKAGAKSKKGA